MDGFKEFFSSILSAASERVTNPFTSAFLLSWSAWNYQFFVIVFDSAPSESRLSAIHSMFQNPAHDFHALTFPLVTAAAYVAIYPWVSLAFIWAYGYAKVAQADLSKKIDKTRVISQAERDRFTRDYEKKISERDQENSALKQDVTALRRALEAAELEVKIYRQQAGESADELKIDSVDLANRTSSELSLKPMLNTNQRKILTRLADSAQGVSVDDLAFYTRLNRAVVEAILNNLQESGLTKSAMVRGSGKAAWTATEAGNRLVVDLLSSS